MARFVRVDTYPPTGFPDRLWGTHPETGGHPLHDAFLRAAPPVVELYSEALAEVGLEGPRSSLVLSVGEDVREAGAVQVRVWGAPPHGFPSEMGFVHLSAPVGRLDAPGRARLALEVVHGGALQLASVRGWEADRLAACRDHVLRSDHTYSWAGPWKASPDRRHRARAAFRIGPVDGFGRAWLEVRDAAGEVVLVSDEAVAFCTADGLRRSAGTLRWSGSDTVGFTPYAGLVPVHDGGPLTARFTPDGWAVALPAPVAVRRPSGDGVAEEPGAPQPEVQVELT